MINKESKSNAVTGGISQLSNSQLLQNPSSHINQIGNYKVSSEFENATSSQLNINNSISQGATTSMENRKNAKDRNSRSGGSSGGIGIVNGMINNITNGIAQKKQMLKGIWNRGSSNTTGSTEINQNTVKQKNENTNPSNFAAKSGRIASGKTTGGSGSVGATSHDGVSRIGKGTNQLMSLSKNMTTAAMNMMQFKSTAQSIDQQSHGTDQKIIQEPKIISKQPVQQISQTQQQNSNSNQANRSFSVNRAFKDITNKVLNSSGAAVIQRNNGQSVISSNQANGNTTITSNFPNKSGNNQSNSCTFKNRGNNLLNIQKSIDGQNLAHGSANQSNTNVGYTGNSLTESLQSSNQVNQKNKRVSPSVNSNNQQPTKFTNHVPQKLQQQQINRNTNQVHLQTKRSVGNNIGSFSTAYGQSSAQQNTSNNSQQQQITALQFLNDTKFPSDNISSIDFKHAPVLKSQNIKTSLQATSQVQSSLQNNIENGQSSLKSTSNKNQILSGNRNSIFNHQSLKSTQIAQQQNIQLNHQHLTQSTLTSAQDVAKQQAISPVSQTNQQSYNQINSSVNAFNDAPSSSNKTSLNYNTQETSMPLWKSSAQVKKNISGSQSNQLRASSRDKLPGIKLHQKLQIFNQRCENQIFSGIQKIDFATMDDVQHVSEFCQEIHKNMLKVEKKWSPNPAYMSLQQKIDETIRSTLIDWLIQIHYNFKLLPETLFLTVNSIDRYFSLFQIQKRDVQLVGIAALLMVTKYEEIYPPTLKDFIYITGDAYTAEEVLEMERKILFSLDFDISQCSSYRFLERLSKLAKIDSVTFFLSQYMLELGLLDSKMSQFPQSLQAVSAIYTAKKYLYLSDKGNESISSSLILSDLQVPQYQIEQVKSCAKCFNQLANLIQKSKLQNILKKFKTPKFLEVARIISNFQNQSISSSVNNNSSVLVKNDGQKSPYRLGDNSTKSNGKRHQSFQSLPSNQKSQKRGRSGAGTNSSSQTKQSFGGEDSTKVKDGNISKSRDTSQPSAANKKIRGSNSNATGY